MASQQTSQEADVLLEQWFRESDPTRARMMMEHLIGFHAEPMIRRIISFKLDSGGGARGSQRADVDDVCGTALYNLLARLHRIKSGESEPAVRNFGGYTAVTAYNACNEFFRNKRPVWVSLSAKVRYLVTHAPQFGLWQTADGLEVCGFAGDRGREPNSDTARLSEACRKRWERQDPARLALADLVDTVLEAAAKPLTFEHLVDAVAECSGVKETRVQSLDEEPGEGVSRWEPADGRPAAESRLSERQYIDRLWKEICELPLEHRKALLFNLQDGAGGDIQLFEFLGVATISQIAAAVEMDALAFAELWKRLPIDDVSIGRELGLSRQDVANRRSAARKRLARKMKDFGGGN